jgi:hypothetical protein
MNQASQQALRVTGPVGSDSPGDRRAFDLSQFRASDRRWKRPYLGIYLAIIVAFGLELCYFVATGDGPLFRGNFRSADAIVDLGIDLVLVAFILFFGLSLPRYLPGAESVLVDDAALTIVYWDRKVDRLSWENPRDRFYIQDFSAWSKWANRGEPYYLYLPLWGRIGRDRRFLITRDLMDAILEKAHEKQAEHRTWQGSSLWNGYSPEVHWFQGKRNGA